MENQLNGRKSSTHSNQTSQEQAGEVQESDKGDQMIMEAEKFQAMVEPPRGKSNLTHNSELGPVEALKNVDQSELNFKHEQVDYDKFFHLTCHVDGSLKSKIEKGKFVELDKLLPKRKLHDDNRLEWVTKDGLTFLSPVQDRDA